MNLSDVVAAGCRYHITVQEKKTDREEKVVKGEEVIFSVHNVLVDVVIFNPSITTGVNGESLVMCRVQASGKGSSARAAERDGIAECLRRVVL